MIAQLVQRNQLIIVCNDDEMNLDDHDDYDAE